MNFINKSNLQQTIDLHVHSNASDGTLSPTEVVLEAKKVGLCAFALTDHDTVDGIEEAKKAVQNLKEKENYDLELISGVELSVGYGKRDIHILGLFIDKDCASLKQSLEHMKQTRDKRNEKMCENLANAGLPISVEALKKEFPDAVLTRAHFAKYLQKVGAVKEMKDAFQKYLREDGPYYVQREYLSPEAAISLIKEANGIPVLAHPLLYHLSEQQVKELIASLKEAGIMGLEVIHSTNINNDESYLRGLASKYELIPTGGSDFHGAVKPTIQIGIGKGNLCIPYSMLEYLKTFLPK